MLMLCFTFGFRLTTYLILHLVVVVWSGWWGVLMVVSNFAVSVVSCFLILLCTFYC